MALLKILSRRNLIRSAVFCLFVVMYFSRGADVRAANLYFSPATVSAPVGSTVTVAVYVSASASINAVSGAVAFPAGQLAVTAVSKSGSIISFWVQDPSFSNSSGVVNFGGVVLSPGFTGNSGRILTITFKVKASGAAALSFSQGSILANDGQGTDVLSAEGKATLALGPAPAAKAPTPAAPSAVPTAPTMSAASVTAVPNPPAISSATHPDQTKWYADASPVLSWLLAPSITGVRLVATQNAQVAPGITYEPPVASKKLTNLADGIWYLRAQLENRLGWGGISDFRLQIDTTAPDLLSVTQVAASTSPAQTAAFSLSAHDSISGLDHYAIKIDGGDVRTWSDSQGVFITPVLAAGSHILAVQAFDKAGNSASSSLAFNVAPAAPANSAASPLASDQNAKAAVAPGQPGAATPLMPMASTELSGSISESQVVTVSLFLIILLCLLLYIEMVRRRHAGLAEVQFLPKLSPGKSASAKTRSQLRADLNRQIIGLEKIRARRRLTKDEAQLMQQLQRFLLEVEKPIYKK